MEKGYNFTTGYILNDCIGSEKLAEVRNYVSKKMQEGFVSFGDQQSAYDAFYNYINTIYENYSAEEKYTISRYSGLPFRRVNSVLRGTWDYEQNGLLTKEIEKESLALADGIREALIKAPKIPFNVRAYRGVNINAFYGYQITSIEELHHLKGKFLYEQAFTSTTLLKENSFFYKQSEWGPTCNVEIECLIPEGSDDGLLLANSEFSVSPAQVEFVINSGSLFQVVDVVISEDKKTAKMTVMLIPQRVWNPVDYEMTHQESSKLK